MTPVIWLPGAYGDLEEILTRIAEIDEQAAVRLKQRIETAVLPLAEQSYIYRKSERVPGLREIVAHPNYIVLYRVATTRVEVVSVVHARQRFPNG